jgi:cation transport regulator
MPYKSVQDLPDRVRSNLPVRAQEIYKDAYNRAWKQYDTEERPGGIIREITVHHAAWTAVKANYKKDAKTGKWYSKS